MLESQKSVSLTIQADTAWIPLVQSIVELGCPVLGLDSSKTLRLTIATEEIVSHLATTAPGIEIECTLTTGGWHVLAGFSFKADPSDLWAMNLVASSDLSISANIDHMGLLLASRMVDDFSLHLHQGVVHLSLRQDCTYPAITPEQANLIEVKDQLSITTNPESAILKEACTRALNLYPAHKVHQAFNSPGKFVDMVNKSDLNTAIALDPHGALAGMICWHSQRTQSVSFFGPYIFAKNDRVAELLTEHLLHAVARTAATGLFSEIATDQLPTNDFESMGHLLLQTENDKPIRQNCWYRHLQEDPGASVWAHPTMVQFLKETYDRHVLMRDIKITDGKGETLPERSVFSARLQPDLHKASLLPMLLGADADDCVKQHIKALNAENYTNIFFRIDLAYGWQATLGGILMNHGFVPQLVLPYGGQSDVVIFQYEYV